MTTRHCSRCEKDLPEPDWSPTDWAKGGWCRACRSEYMRARTPHYNQVRAAKYRADNPPKPRPVRLCANDDCGRPPSTPTSKYCGTCRLARQQAKRTPDHEMSYNLAHSRVARFRGRPGSHQCEHCDQPAEHWAYDHADPAERMGVTNRGRPAPFSADPAHYLALCRSCHTLFDNAQSRP